MKISASLYANKQRPLEDVVKELDRCHIDCFHIDCNDDPAVFETIRQIRQISSTPIDLHIISDTPAQYYELIETIRPELVTFQYEQLTRQEVFPNFSGVSYGLALASDTNVEVFEAYKEQCDFVLIMTTTPGQSGETFRRENFKKISRFRNRYPSKGIHVDGGVNDETGFILRLLGVHTVVSGSFLLNHQSLAEALLHLRSSVVHSEYQVKDWMTDVADAPILTRGDFDVKAAIRKIDEGNIGFAVVQDDTQKLHGLISNADVRKGLIKNLDDLNGISLEDITNVSPVYIHESATISDLLALIQSKKFLISYLPVVDQHHALTGVLSFINLIRSES